jgi:hypothetical protein
LGTAAPAPTPIVLTPNSIGTSASPITCGNNTQLGQILATGGTGTFTPAASPTGTATGGPLVVPPSTAGPITISVGPDDAHGDWTINVSSGSAAPVQAVVHCTP